MTDPHTDLRTFYREDDVERIAEELRHIDAQKGR